MFVEVLDLLHDVHDIIEVQLWSCKDLNRVVLVDPKLNIDVEGIDLVLETEQSRINQELIKRSFIQSSLKVVNP